jgi:Secreted and surface protein containing fasciclin-like repeats
MKSKIALSVALALASLSATAQVTVGGAAMYSSRDIIDNAVESKDHTTLVAAVKAADLVQTLKGAGPFTVFAPTNEAFAQLPAGTVDTLLMPENKPALTKTLTYHVVSGAYDSNALRQKVQAGHGKTMLRTVEGEQLTITERGNGLAVTDARGATAQVTIADVTQSNGVIHVVDKVLMPAAPKTAQAQVPMLSAWSRNGIFWANDVNGA